MEGAVCTVSFPCLDEALRAGREHRSQAQRTEAYARLFARCGLLDSLFEHPEVILVSTQYGNFQPYCDHQPSLSAAFRAQHLRQPILSPTASSPD